MASSAIKSEEDKQEFFDSAEELDRKISKLAQYIMRSKSFIGFTGAGISTSCGIPDFRSGYNTVLETGPGAWEVLSEKKPSKNVKTVEMTEAIPSFTHMAFVSLINSGLMKHVISQNVDGLHRKSGILPKDISELHGNIYVEKCLKCGKDYLRDFDVVTSNCATDHKTGKFCDNSSCRGELIDNIINFGENLDREVIGNAFEFARHADLCLSMGSSLRVTPAASIPKIVGKNGKLVIVNLQKTPLDKYAKLVIHGFCDVVIKKLMEKLKLEIYPFRLIRFLKISKSSRFLIVEGIDYDDSPFDYIRSVRFYCETFKRRVKKIPYMYSLEDGSQVDAIKLHFHGHYGEPGLKIKVDQNFITKKLKIIFDPFSGTWAVELV